MRFTLKIWRQASGQTEGSLATYNVDNVQRTSTIVEVLTDLNHALVLAQKPPIAFESDCLKGNCGACSMVINGRPHGPGRGLAACQLPMRAFVDGATLTVEPLRARPFEVVEDLIADRGPVRRILEAGQIPSTAASAASIQSGFCIECGACVAACRNASASLLLGAKVLEHSRRPMPRKRVLDMVNAADEGGFGACSNDGVCEAICPKEVSLDVISALNRAFFAAAWRGPED